MDDVVVAGTHQNISLPFVWQHGGASITLGYDRGLPASPDYRPPFRWSGVLHQVRIDAGNQPPLTVERIRQALQRD